jgi:hypothetical protein
LIHRLVWVSNCFALSDFRDRELDFIAPPWKVDKYPSFLRDCHAGRHCIIKVGDRV